MKKTEDAPHPTDVHVGNQLRLARRQRQMSQSALGVHAGVSFQQLQKYERAKNRVSASTLFTFAKALDVPVGYFYDGL